MGAVLRAARARYGAGRWARNLAAALALAALPACAQEAVVTAFGDSLIQGYGLPEERGFTAQLQDWLDARDAQVRVVNAGVSGDTTAGGAARIDWTLSEAPDGLIVTLGGNDLLRGLDPEAARANLRTILEAAEAAGVPVLLAGLEAPGNYGAEYQAAFDAIWPDLAAEYGTLLYPDWFAPLRSGGSAAESRALLQGDGIHPNAAGVARIVEEIGPLVLELVGRE